MKKYHSQLQSAETSDLFCYLYKKKSKFVHGLNHYVKLHTRKVPKLCVCYYVQTIQFTVFTSWLVKLGLGYVSILLATVDLASYTFFWLCGC